MSIKHSKDASILVSILFIFLPTTLSAFLCVLPSVSFCLPSTARLPLPPSSLFCRSASLLPLLCHCHSFCLLLPPSPFYCFLVLSFAFLLTRLFFRTFHCWIWRSKAKKKRLTQSAFISGSAQDFDLQLDLQKSYLKNPNSLINSRHFCCSNCCHQRVLLLVSPLLFEGEIRALEDCTCTNICDNLPVAWMEKRSSRNFKSLGKLRDNVF